MNKELIWTGVFAATCTTIGLLFGKLTSDKKHAEDKCVMVQQTYSAMIDVILDKKEKYKKSEEGEA